MFVPCPTKNEGLSMRTSMGMSIGMSMGMGMGNTNNKKKHMFGTANKRIRILIETNKQKDMSMMVSMMLK